MGATIFVGKLKGLQDELLPRSKLISTKFLPSLEGVTWDVTTQDLNPLPKSLQLDFKRSKIKVEIIQKESDANAKFEVFQRLNTGGTFLSEQEVRNCLLVMLNQPAFEWLEAVSHFDKFEESLSLTDRAISERYDMELALKYFALSRYELGGKDVSEFLTDSVEKLFVERDIATVDEMVRFKKLFTLLINATGEYTFRRFSNQKFQGRFLDSAFEPISLGLGFNLDSYDENDQNDITLVAEKIKSLWAIPEMLANVGSGSNAKVRIPRLIALGRNHFAK